MTRTSDLKIEANGEREMVMTRSFAAPRELVFEALTRPELVRRWLGGMEGWTMPVCEIDLRVGGRYRYLWRKEDEGIEMGMGGVYREIVAPARIVATEKFDDAWYPGEAVGTFELVESGGATKLTQTMRYDSRAARDAVLASPMEDGVEMSYDRLEAVVTETQASA